MDQLWFYLVLAVGGGVTYVGATFHEASKYEDIRRARSTTYRDHATARSVIDRTATQHGLVITGWSERDEGYSKAVYGPGASGSPPRSGSMWIPRGAPVCSCIRRDRSRTRRWSGTSQAPTSRSDTAVQKLTSDLGAI